MFLSQFITCAARRFSKSGRPTRRRDPRVFQVRQLQILENRCLLAASSLTASEQMMLELMNRARANPAAEAARQGISLNQGLPAGTTISSTPKQPLAPNNLLAIASDVHTSDMMARGFFDHTSPAPNSTTFDARVRDAGYVFTTVGENLALQEYNTLDQMVITVQMHNGLYASPSHRPNMMNNDFFEASPGNAFGSFTDNGNVLGQGAGRTTTAGASTILFATQAAKPFITGVVYTDASNSSATDDSFYSIGEAAGAGGTITATNTVTGVMISETIGAAGGYSLEVPAGTYNVTAEGGGLASIFGMNNVVVGTSNVKVDIETTTAMVVTPNMPPQAVDDAFTSSQGAVVTGNVITFVTPTGADSDADGGTLSISTTPATAPTKGTLVLMANGDFTYTPDSGATGSDVFSYTLLDGQGGTDTATVTITLDTTSNRPPVANDDEFSARGTVPVTGNVIMAATPTSLDTDPDGDTLMIDTTPVSGPTQGSVTLMADGSFTYVANAGASGSDTFVYRLNDGNGGSDTATVTINFDIANIPPVARDDAFTTSIGTPLTGNVINSNTPTSSDTDADGGVLSVDTTPLVAPTMGTLTLMSNGSFTYQANAGAAGSDSFTYTLNDGQGGSDTATVTITINSSTSAPIARDDSFTVDAASQLTGNVITNTNGADTAGSGGVLTISTSPVTAPQKGDVVLNADGSFTYTSEPDATGTDSFVYTLNEASGGTDTATVTIVINGGTSNASPVARNDSFTATIGSPLVGNVITNTTPDGADTDADGDALSISTTPVSPPSKGTLQLSADGSFTYTANPGATGTDSFVYTLNDDQGGTDTATVNLTISTTATTFDFDVDGDGGVNPFTDAVLIFAWMSNGTPDSVFETFISSSAPTSVTPTSVKQNLEANAALFDIDGDGSRNPFQDAVLLFAALSSGTPDSTLENFISPNAAASRNTAAGIRSHVASLSAPSSGSTNTVDDDQFFDPSEDDDPSLFDFDDDDDEGTAPVYAASQEIDSVFSTDDHESLLWQQLLG